MKNPPVLSTLFEVAWNAQNRAHLPVVAGAPAGASQLTAFPAPEPVVRASRLEGVGEFHALTTFRPR